VEANKETLAEREQINAPKPQPAESNDYSLNAVGYINVQGATSYDMLSAPLITPPASNGAIGLQGGTAPPSQSAPVQSITMDRPGKGQVASTNFFVDKDAGKVFVKSDDQTAAYVSQVISNPGVTMRGVGGLTDLGDAQTNGLQDSAAITPDVIALKYASASDIASALSGLGASGGAAVGRSSPGAPLHAANVRSMFQNNLNKTVENTSGAEKSRMLANTKVIADERSNSLLIYADANDKKKIEDILKKLDTDPEVAIALPAHGGQQGRDGQQQSQATAGRHFGLNYVTATNNAVEVQQKIAAYLAGVGADLAPPKAVFFDDRTGDLLVRGSQKDLEIVQQAIATLDKAATEVTAEARSPGTTSGLDLYDKTFRVDPTTFVQGLQKAKEVSPKLAPQNDSALPRPALPPPIPQPEVFTSTNIFSTFSLNVSDASFKLAAASLQNGVMPEAGSIRSEEFINAFDYRDPEPAPGAPIGFFWERAGYPFAHNRDSLRFSVKTAAQGRQEGRPLNLVLLLDKSGSMERADRVEIIQQALRVLASQLHAQDTLSVVVFARTARLWVDGVPGSHAGAVADGLSSLTPEGGTNLEEAMRLAYETALRHYQAKGDNRVVLLTDGAANLGDVKPETLQQRVEANRKQGIALDCFGVGWDGYNDTLMETLSRAGHGRYGFINTPEEAATEFAGKLAGALRVAASDVKVQVEFNPNRVTAYRQIGYARHQLTKEQFRDNTVAAAQIGAAESGNALYTVEVNAAGDGPLCTVRVRFRVPGTSDYQEHAWDVPYTGTSAPLDQASPAMRLAATASAFSEWLAASPYASEVTPDQLLADLRGVPEVYGADTLPKKLEWMIRQAKSIAGK
jgi:Mg-chelatase subunit ChlD